MHTNPLEASQGVLTVFKLISQVHQFHFHSGAFPDWVLGVSHKLYLLTILQISLRVLHSNVINFKA